MPSQQDQQMSNSNEPSNTVQILSRYSNNFGHNLQQSKSELTHLNDLTNEKGLIQGMINISFDDDSTEVVMFLS